MSWTLIQDSKAERREIEYLHSAWAKVDGKCSFLLLVAEMLLQNVAVSSLALETTGIHQFLVRYLDLKKKQLSQVFTRATMCTFVYNNCIANVLC